MVCMRCSWVFSLYFGMFSLLGTTTIKLYIVKIDGNIDCLSKSTPLYNWVDRLQENAIL